MYFWIALIFSIILGGLKIGLGIAIPWIVVTLPVGIWLGTWIAVLAVAGWAIIKAIRFSIRTVKEFTSRVKLPE